MVWPQLGARLIRVRVGGRGGAWSWLTALPAERHHFLGISIVGQSNDRGDGGIYIGSIMKGGAVAADGRIEPGDMLLQVGLWGLWGDVWLRVGLWGFWRDVRLWMGLWGF